MKRFKEIFIRLFSPGLPLTVVLCVVSTVLLVYVFANKLEQSVVAYVAYIVSAYTLVSVSLSIPNVIKTCKKILYGNKHSKRYLTEEDLRTKTALYSGLSIHLIYSVFKLCSGIYYNSVWFISEAVYHMIIGIVQFLIVRNDRRNESFIPSEWKVYRVCGVLMLLLNTAISAVVALSVFQNKSYVYSGIIIYATAAYTFYRFIVSFVQIAKYRKRNRPVLLASKFLNLSASLMSLFALQTAMLTQFDDGTVNAKMMNTATGSFVVFSVIYIAVSMIIRSTKEINKTKT